jgi:aconitate hydratase
MTLAEKVLLGHLDNPADQKLERGVAYLDLRPDRVAMQDATAQMALLQFMQAGRKEVAVPSTVHCDHLIQARVGAKDDLAAASDENREVYDFLASVSEKYGIGFWKPGSGIIHQIVLENYAFPGGLMIGTDSHTPNAGGLGMFAVGVGGADAVDVMAGFPWEVLQPRVIGVHLKGQLSGWASPKDVILKLLGILTVKGGTNAVIEYFGEGTESISATGKGTITNMGAELGATTSIFPFDARMEAYLRGTERGGVADLAVGNKHLITADAEVAQDPGKYFDRVIEIDLSSLEPHIVGPHTPDLARPISEMAAAVDSEGYPDEVSATLIGSCTNSSYEDISRATDVAEQALNHGVKARSEFWVSPGSDKIYATIKRDGQMDTLTQIGATVLANACGPCIGQWRRDSIEKGTRNSIVTSFNRNFRGRNDANPETLGFIASPEIVVAYALSGSLSFNPATDQIRDAPDLPPDGFESGKEGYQAPADDGSSIEVKVKPDSERLELLTPFPPREADQLQQIPLLLKTQGKTTTDHISPAGPWLRYRGHLDRISDNMFTGAINAFGGGRGTTRNPVDGSADQAVPAVARALKAQGRMWAVVGDENYGEGSSREHAAMCPRHLGAGVVIVRSFARIHETNLKKQAVLPLTFADSTDYDKVRETDTVSVPGISDLAPGKDVKVVFHHDDGTTDEAMGTHSLNADQIKWFWAGSALNLLREGNS